MALTVSGPRFLTLGDQARLELAVHNVEGPAGGRAALLVELVAALPHCGEHQRGDQGPGEQVGGDHRETDRQRQGDEELPRRSFHEK